MNKIETIEEEEEDSTDEYGEVVCVKPELTPEYQFMKLRWKREKKEQEQRKCQVLRTRSTIPKSANQGTVKSGPWLGFRSTSTIPMKKVTFSDVTSTDQDHVDRTSMFLDANKSLGVFSIPVINHSATGPGESRNLPMFYSKGTLLHNPRVISNEIIRTSKLKQENRKYRINQLESRIEASRKKRKEMEEKLEQEAERKRKQDDMMRDTRKGYGNGKIDNSLIVTKTGTRTEKDLERRERIKRKTFFTSKNFRMTSLLNALEKRDYKNAESTWYET